MKAILFTLIIISISCNQELKSQTMDKNLIGTWNTDEDDEKTMQTIGKVTITFTHDGKLVYDIIEDGKIQRINMIYKVEGDFIISDQPSNPQEQKTKFKLENNKLLLVFNGEKTMFKRSH